MVEETAAIQQPKVRSYRDLRVWQAGMDLAEGGIFSRSATAWGRCCTGYFGPSRSYNRLPVSHLSARLSAHLPPADLPASPLEVAHQFRLGENVAPHGGVKFTSSRGGAQISFCVKRVKPDEIAVGFTGRGTGAAVPGS